jgi:hypothetical protein
VEPFSKRLLGAAAIGGRTPQRAKVPFYVAICFAHHTLFSLTLSAQREKLSKRESANEEISPSADGDQRYARWIGGRF